MNIRKRQLYYFLAAALVSLISLSPVVHAGFVPKEAFIITYFTDATYTSVTGYKVQTCYGIEGTWENADGVPQPNADGIATQFYYVDYEPCNP